MLDRLLEHPVVALGFIVIVVFMAGFYLMNRERAKVARMRGPTRFQPDWGRTSATGRRRRRRRSGSFSPEWNRKSRTAPGAPARDSAPEPASAPSPGPASAPTPDPTPAPEPAGVPPRGPVSASRVESAGGEKADPPELDGEASEGRTPGSGERKAPNGGASGS